MNGPIELRQIDTKTDDLIICAEAIVTCDFAVSLLFTVMFERMITCKWLI